MGKIESAASNEEGHQLSFFNPASSRRTFVRNLLASGLVLGSNGLAMKLSSAQGAASEASAHDGLPSLDELASDWCPMNSLGSFPALNNFVGSLQITDDLVGVKHLTFPPFSQAHDSGMLRVNGRPLWASDSRWYPYQILRRAKLAGLELESSVRMVHENRGILFRLKVVNLQKETQTVEVSLNINGRVGKFESGWDWELPLPKDADQFVAKKAGDGNILLIRHAQSSAGSAWGFVQKPDRLELEGGRGRTTWNLVINPGQRQTIDFVMAVGDGDDEPAHLAKLWALDFNNRFDSAKTHWERFFADAFVPGNGRFSGSLPVLEIQDTAIRRVYYLSILSSMLSMFRTNFPLQPRVYVTGTPMNAVTLTYFWDSAMVPFLTALLDPAMMREQLKRWLTMNIYICYAEDCYSGHGRGPWYSANDVSLFEMLHAYLQVTGDSAFLDEQAGSKTVIEHMRGLVTHWKLLVNEGSSLADYGEADNLLECVPTYIHAVASLNAANVGMMRIFASLVEWKGDRNEAAQLRDEAARLAAGVMKLYRPGQGVWDCLQPDGTHLEVRHVYDFIMTGKWMCEDLSPSMRSEMMSFVNRELMTKNWMRALSLQDPAASRSDRPDHGPMGAYDSWPPLTLAVMNRFGYHKDALEALRRFEGVTHEGPFSQAHELLGADYDARARIAERGSQVPNEICGGAFADVIIKSFFGFQPDLAGKGPLADTDSPRALEGSLIGLRWRNKHYTVNSGANGVSMQVEQPNKVL